MKIAAGRMSNTPPTVVSVRSSASWSDERPIAKPPATINLPRRLSGRRHQAISPAAMYGIVIQSSSAIWMSLPSFGIASASSMTASATPASAIAARRNGLGVRALDATGWSATPVIAMR
jgi:hypothetical protein